MVAIPLADSLTITLPRSKPPRIDSRPTSMLVLWEVPSDTPSVSALGAKAMGPESVSWSTAVHRVWP